MPDFLLFNFYAKHLVGFSPKTLPLFSLGIQYLLIFFAAWAIAWTSIDIVRGGGKTLVAFGFILLLLTGSMAGCVQTPPPTRRPFAGHVSLASSQPSSAGPCGIVLNAHLISPVAASAAISRPPPS